MSIDLKALAERVRKEVDTYQVPARHPEQVGLPLPESWFAENLANMRNALVEPYWTDVEDYDPARGGQCLRKVAVVADDTGGTGYLLAFDPLPDDDDFVMVGSENGQLKLYNIRGDAVGCFLAF